MRHALANAAGPFLPHTYLWQAWDKLRGALPGSALSSMKPLAFVSERGNDAQAWVFSSKADVGGAVEATSGGLNEVRDPVCRA